MKKILITLFCLMSLRSLSQEPDKKYFQENVQKPVAAFNSEISRLVYKYQQAKEWGTLDTAGLREQVYETVRKCFRVSQDFIGKYPSSPFCIDALKMLGRGRKDSPLKLEDLERLFNSLSEEVKNSEAGKDYAAQLKEWK